MYKNSLSQCLSVSIFCLLVAGTLSAKTVFLVDNNLEKQTELSGKNWQVNPQSIRRYANDIEKLVYKYSTFQ
jgi:hypothetical protein